MEYFHYTIFSSRIHLIKMRNNGEKIECLHWIPKAKIFQLNQWIDVSDTTREVVPENATKGILLDEWLVYLWIPMNSFRYRIDWVYKSNQFPIGWGRCWRCRRELDHNSTTSECEFVFRPSIVSNNINNIIRYFIASQLENFTQLSRKGNGISISNGIKLKS